MLTLHAARPACGEELLVSAASSLTEAAAEIGKSFEQTHPGVQVRFSFGASGTLSRQIEQGAPTDVLMAASELEMKQLDKKGLLFPGSQLIFAKNRLALIAGRRSQIHSIAELGNGKVARIAIAQPESVPSGRYAKDLLQRRGLWQAVQSRLIYGHNVRQVLRYVAAGDADVGFVYMTDIKIEAGRVHLVEMVREGKDLPPIRYPAAVVRRSKVSISSKQFVVFLQSAPARKILQNYGFLLPAVPVKNRHRH